MSDLIVILLCVCLHSYSAKELAQDIKDVLYKSNNLDQSNVDDILNMLRMESTTKDYKTMWRGGGGGGGPHDHLAGVTTHPPPYIDAEGNVNNTVQLGSEYVLHCKVFDASFEHTVSWMKRRGNKLNLISVGQELYSKDAKFSVKYSSPNDWQLKLKMIEHSDEGQYECHVSSHPPITQSFFLKVLVPEMKVADERGLPIKNKFYNSGSTIELNCIISKVPHTSLVINWRHGNKVLNNDSQRGGISVKTDVTDDGALSRLFIANSNPEDSGNYTCSLADISHISVSVVVLNGESPAAMHVGGEPRQATCSPTISALFLFLTLLGYY